MFDSFNDEFNNAALKVVKKYNLIIHVYLVTSSSVISNLVGIYGNRGKIVNIAMFGQYHFELIVKDGELFVPAVIFKNNLTKINKIKINKQKYLKLNEIINNNIAFKYELKETQTLINEQRQTISLIQETSDDVYESSQIKQEFIKLHKDYLENIKQYESLLTENIKQFEEEIASLQLIIQKYEKEN